MTIRTPRPRLYEWRLECGTTREQAEAVDRAFPDVIDRASKIRLLIGLGLQAMGIDARPAQANGVHHHQANGAG